MNLESVYPHEIQAQKAHKGQPITDLIFHLIIGELMEGLEHEDFEHDERHQRPAASFAPIGALQGLGKRGLKFFSRNQGHQAFQRISMAA
jgi:hypothetical protein